MYTSLKGSVQQKLRWLKMMPVDRYCSDVAALGSLLYVNVLSSCIEHKSVSSQYCLSEVGTNDNI
jgi:hypothetical protein